MPSHRFQCSFASLKGLPQNSKTQSGFCLVFFQRKIDNPPPPSVFLGFLQGNRLKIGNMHEALTAMVCNQLLWGFAHILYLTTLRSNIPPCQKATTLILIPLDNPSFHLGKSSKNLWALLYFCLGRLLKSVTVTSFSQLHLSRNYGSSWSLDQINLHFLALHTRWLIKKGEKCEKLSRFFVGMENFTFREMHVDEKSMGKS